MNSLCMVFGLSHNVIWFLLIHFSWIDCKIKTIITRQIISLVVLNHETCAPEIVVVKAFSVNSHVLYAAHDYKRLIVVTVIGLPTSWYLQQSNSPFETMNNRRNFKGYVFLNTYSILNNAYRTLLYDLREHKLKPL